MSPTVAHSSGFLIISQEKEFSEIRLGGGNIVESFYFQGIKPLSFQDLCSLYPAIEEL